MKRVLMPCVFLIAMITSANAADFVTCYTTEGKTIITNSPPPGAICRGTGDYTPSAPVMEPLESFQANLLIVRSHAEIERWVRLEPSKRQGNVGRLRNVKRSDKIYVPVVATFPQSQVGQRIDLSADFELVAPSGQVHRITGCCLANHVDPRVPTTIVLNPVVDFTFDAEDASGEYTVLVRISNGRETVAAKERFRLQ